MFDELESEQRGERWVDIAAKYLRAAAGGEVRFDNEAIFTVKRPRDQAFLRLASAVSREESEVLGQTRAPPFFDTHTIVCTYVERLLLQSSVAPGHANFKEAFERKDTKMAQFDLPAPVASADRRWKANSGAEGICWPLR